VWQLKERQSPACGYEKRPSPCPPYGDLDDDGYVTYNDIILAWLYELYNDWDAVKEKTPLSEEEFKHRADVNGDGKIDMKDVMLIANYSYYNPDFETFPVCGAPPSEQPSGDITKVELDGRLLPEGDTLRWVRNNEAAIRVYFKNVGNAPGKFHIWVTDEDGVTLCDLTTSTEIPADGVERYVTCGKFTPTEVEKKTLTAHIEP